MDAPAPWSRSTFHVVIERVLDGSEHEIVVRVLDAGGVPGSGVELVHRQEARSDRTRYGFIAEAIERVMDRKLGVGEAPALPPSAAEG